MIGQSQVTEPLMTALRTGRIGHAYLFSGPRGCGKTTSARILARCLNCAEGPTDTPCGVCPSCVELSRGGGGSLDVVEIDAASHGGVDDARDLRERAAFAPARDRFKIFIIDEAHMVTAAGFNALLKIVEEPPPHVKFVFATTEPDKVIGTIRSRTHHYPFRLIAPGTLIDYVQTLCDSEGVRVEPGVLPLVVRAGGGSVRDTLSILDQLIAGSEGDSVTADRAAGLLGFTHTELLDDVVIAFGAHDAAAAFGATDRVVQTGQDPRRFVEDLLERLRDLIVVGATTVDGAAAVFRGVPQDQLTRMFEQAQQFGPGDLSRIADVVSAALDKMAGATAPRMQLELMIARVLVEHSGSAAGPADAGSRGTALSAQPAPAQSAPAAPASAPQRAAAPAAAPQPAAAAQASTPMPAPASHAPLQEAPPAQQQRPAAQAPNAAQTAASIREFLREDPSAQSAPARAQAQAPAQGAAPTPGAAPHEGQVPGTAAPTDRAANAPTQQPAPNGRPDGAAPHPNEGAAKFGRPISDVLSSAQIESIGTDAPRAGGSAGTPSVQQTPAQLSPEQPSPGRASEAPVAAAQATSASTPARPAAGGAADDGAPASDAAAAPEHADAEPGFDDLLELWPDLLEEILEQDRDAWNAVRPVQPLSLDGDILTVGIASGSDLAAFKAAGAGPLREAILSAVGVSVRYVPKRMPAETQHPEPGGQEPGGRSGTPGASPDAEEPHPAGSPASLTPRQQPDAPGAAPNTAAVPGASAVGRPTEDPMERAKARLSGLGPALAAPAWADPPVATTTAPAADAGTPAGGTPTSPAVEKYGTAEMQGAAVSVPTPVASAAPASPAAASAAAEHAAAETGAQAHVVSDPAAPETTTPKVVESESETEPATAAPSAPLQQAPTQSEPFADDPYANDPYAGEPSGEYDDDPYAAGPGPSREPAPAAEPTSAVPVSEPPAPAPVSASPAPESAGPPASAPVSVPPVPEAAGRAANPAPAERDQARTAPKFTRYGEAVVREVLGARFVEERPLPPRLEA